MRPDCSVSVAVLLFTVACAEMPSEAPNESTQTDDVLAVNRIGLNRIGLNRIGLNRIGLNRIGLNRIGLNRLSVNLETAGELLSTDDGREVFSLAMSCALDGNTTLVATIDGTNYEFPGEIGLAPGWIKHSLSDEDEGWVSACMFARANLYEVVLPISMRGPHPALATDFEERRDFPLEEGAFYGNIFGPTTGDIPWYACRGRDQARSNAGGLADRACAEPDPANPGYTLCGLIYAGECGSVLDHACEHFSLLGKYYDRCEEPGADDAPPGSQRNAEPGRDCGPGDGQGGNGHRTAVSRQVITTYVTL